MRGTPLCRLIAAASMAVAVSCIRPPPVVEVSDVPPAPSALGKVAVAPFAAGPALAQDSTAAGLVERFVTEAIAGAGIEVIPASEIRIAFGAQGLEPPLEDLRALTAAADRDFKATSLLRGRVTRFRERDRGDAQNPLPASVAFELTLHAVPGGRRVWTARFEETQVETSVVNKESKLLKIGTIYTIMKRGIRNL